MFIVVLVCLCYNSHYKTLKIRKNTLMFVEIVRRVIENPSGEKVNDVSMGLLLNVKGQEQAVDVQELTDIYLDNESIDLATKLYVTYLEQEYVFDLPAKTTADWQYLEDLIDME